MPKSRPARGPARSGDFSSAATRAAPPYRFFTEAEGGLLIAICEQLIPTDDTPGATDIGAIHYIDRQLTGFFARHQPTYRRGLEAFRQTYLQEHRRPFESLGSAEKIAALRALELGRVPRALWGDLSPTAFFNLVLAHTMQGFYGSPRHGGNRDYARLSHARPGLSAGRRPKPPRADVTMTLPHVNAVVVGAGAGGGVVAKELSEAGLSVVLLERGGWVSFETHGHDELINQRTTVLGNSCGPDERYPRVVASGPGKSTVVLPHEGGYGNNAACVGSGTVTYGAMAWRFLENDFRMRSTYGALAGSTLDDWPISYAELEPFYEKAEYEIGVAGDMGANPVSAPRHRPYPMPAFPYNREGRLLEAAAKRLGFHPFPIPMLRNSVPYGGRNACIHNRYCVGFPCPNNAKNGTHNTVIPRALATGHCELRTQCVVSEIVVDGRGRARGVNYFDATDRAQYQPADLVVVAGAAIETARLLLNSKSKLFPNGAGNRHDWVGRNLQGHAYSGARGLFTDETYDDVGPGATIAISDFNHGNAGVRGGAALCNEFIRPPYAFSNQRPAGEARWGQAHKDYQRRFFKRSVNVQGPVQEMPVFEARVEVDPTVRDHWGVPVARLSGSRHPHDVEIGRFIADKAEQWLKEAGAIRTWTSVPGRGVSGGQHQAGTCRMGNDPTTSVTNRHGQVHDIDNLFIADGSLHVTNGGFNPALTIMALGYWVSDYIKAGWKTGKFT